MSTQVKSHTTGRPNFQGISVIPSGRFPSSRLVPVGSRIAGISAESKAFFNRVLTSWWRESLPELNLQLKPCKPNSSTREPHLQECSAQMGEPRRRPTAILKDSLSSKFPVEAIGRAFSQAPDSEEETAKSRALFWLVEADSMRFFATKSRSGLSHAFCFFWSLSERERLVECCHSSNPSVKYVSVIGMPERERINFINCFAQANDDRKQGSAKDRTDLVPKPPMSTGKEACFHVTWSMILLHTFSREILKISSISSRIDERCQVG